MAWCCRHRHVGIRHGRIHRLACGEKPSDIIIPAIHKTGPRREGGDELAGPREVHLALQSIPYGLFAWRYSQPAPYRLFSLCATRLRGVTPSWQGPWIHSRAALRPAARRLHEGMKSRGGGSAE